jgi:hypothetical protein
LLGLLAHKQEEVKHYAAANIVHFDVGNPVGSTI